MTRHADRPSPARPKRPQRAVSALLAAISALSLQATAQNSEERAEEPIEEITVVGEKTLLNLKFAAYRAEEDFFELFNELNEKDEFDVFCDNESNTYSRVKRRRCWSPFEREIEEDAIRDMVGASGQLGGGTRMLPRNEGLIRAKRKQQAEMLQQMVLENPELQKLYHRYGQANIEFYGERERRCANNLLCKNPHKSEDQESKE